MSRDCDDVNIERYRGDTRPILRTVFSLQERANKDITAWNFLLTVNLNENPADVTGQQFQLTGVLADSSGEIIGFQPTALQADWIGTRWYDIQAVDENLDTITLVKGAWIQKETITK